MSYHYKKLLRIIFFLPLYFMSFTYLYGMNTHDNIDHDLHKKEFFKQLKKLSNTSRDVLQVIIQFALKDAIDIIASQPLSCWHDGMICSIALQGNKVCACTEDVATIWDIQSGKVLHVCGGHSDVMVSIAANTTQLVTGSRDAMVKIWDIDSGILVRTIQAHQRGITCVALYDKYLVTGSYDATVKLWDVDTGQLLHTFIGHIKEICSVAIDDAIIVSGSKDKTAKVWDITRKALLYTLKGHAKKIWEVILSDDKIITCAKKKTVKIWDKKNSILLHTLEAEDDDYVMAIATQNDQVITGSLNGNIRIWDMNNGTLLRRLYEYADDCVITALAIRDMTLFIGKGSGCVNIWSLVAQMQGAPDANPLVWLTIIPEENYALRMLQLDFIKRAAEYTKKDEALVITLPKKLGVIEQDELDEHRDARIYFTFPYAVREYLRNRLYITANYHKVILQELKNISADVQRNIMQYVVHDAVQFLGYKPHILKHDKESTALAAQNGTLAIGFKDGFVQLWDMYMYGMPHMLNTYKAHDDWIKTIELCGNVLITGSKDNKVKIWDIDTLALRNFEVNTENTRSVVINDNKIAFESWDKTIKIWDINNGTLLYSFDNMSDLITMFDDRLVVKSDKSVKTIDNVDVSLCTFNYMVTAAYGNILVIGTDRMAKVFDIKKNKLLHMLDLDCLPLVLALNDEILVIVFLNKKVYTWNVHSGELLRIIEEDDRVCQVAIECNNIITRLWDKTTKIWPLFLPLNGDITHNPLAWIMAMPEEDAVLRMLQADFINRAYEVTEDKDEDENENDFILDLPKKLSVVAEDETQEQKDCRIYFTFPVMVREYLRNQLKIRK